MLLGISDHLTRRASVSVFFVDHVVSSTLVANVIKRDIAKFMKWPGYNRKTQTHESARHHLVSVLSGFFLHVRPRWPVTSDCPRVLKHASLYLGIIGGVYPVVLFKTLKICSPLASPDDTGPRFD